MEYLPGLWQNHQMPDFYENGILSATTESRIQCPKGVCVNVYLIMCSHRIDPYGSSKRAIDLLTVALNARLSSRGVTAYSTCPGLFMSQITFNLLPKWVWMMLVPLLCFVRTTWNELTTIIMHLASAASVCIDNDDHALQCCRGAS